MPMNKKNYPPDWPKISKAARERAGNRCEQCYAPNGVRVVRTKDGLHPWELPTEGDTRKTIKIVLTVHHINGHKMDSHDHNLLAACQKCHLRLDMAKHVANRRARRGGDQQRIAL
jgi:hypothetical protein